MGFAGHSFRPGIVNAGTGKAYQRNHTPKEQIDLAETGELPQYPAGDQAVIRMVKHNLHAHGVQEPVEAFGGEAFEKSIGLSGGTHTVDNLVACVVLTHHLVHGVDVILSVAVDGNGDVTAVKRFHQSGQHSVLVTAVAALGNAEVMLILFGQLCDQLPGSVPAAVVHEQNPAVFRDQAKVGKFL